MDHKNYHSVCSYAFPFYTNTKKKKKKKLREGD